MKAGVYIFTHKATGSKYVGSSNSLSRRLDQYFTFKHFNQENSGLLLPLIKKDGFGAFNLEIFVVPVSRRDRTFHMQLLHINWNIIIYF